jgi:L-ascorbate metabolism protein UlaG (beta-lactamase superfamily)
MRSLFHADTPRRRSPLRWLLPAAALIVVLSLGMAGDGSQRIYTNSDGSVISKPLTSVVAWNIHRLVRYLTSPAPAQANATHWPLIHDAASTHAAQPGELSVTWIGHATALLRIGGLNVLTDPNFSERASPVSWAGPKRQVPVPFGLDQLPHIDAVLISHNHYDHLDEASVLALNRQAGGPPLFLVPEGLADWFRERGIERVSSVPWWQQETLSQVTFHAVPAHHWSARSLADRNHSHWAGWVVENSGQRVYFAGDTGYSKDFTAIGERFGPVDLALLPVGAYEPRDFMRDQHVDPEEAVAIARDVHAKVSVGIHWGTFSMADEALEAPLTELPRARQQAGLADDAFRLLAHGETLVLHAPTSAPSNGAQTP